MGKQYDTRTREDISLDVTMGISSAEICARYDIDPKLFETWVKCNVFNDAYWLKGPKQFAMTDDKVREILAATRDESPFDDPTFTKLLVVCNRSHSLTATVRQCLCFQLGIAEKDKIKTEKLIDMIRAGAIPAIEKPDWEEYKRKNYKRKTKKTEAAHDYTATVAPATQEYNEEPKQALDDSLGTRTGQAFRQYEEEQLAEFNKEHDLDLPSSVLDLPPIAVTTAISTETEAFPTNHSEFLQQVQEAEYQCRCQHSDPDEDPKDLQYDPFSVDTTVDTKDIPNFNNIGKDLLVMCPLCNGLQCSITNSTYDPFEGEGQVNIEFKCDTCRTLFMIRLYSEETDTTAYYSKQDWVPL